MTPAERLVLTLTADLALAAAGGIDMQQLLQLQERLRHARGMLDIETYRTINQDGEPEPPA
jgi:hypothetical protein